MDGGIVAERRGKVGMVGCGWWCRTHLWMVVPVGIVSLHKLHTHAIDPGKIAAVLESVAWPA